MPLITCRKVSDENYLSLSLVSLVRAAVLDPNSGANRATDRRSTSTERVANSSSTVIVAATASSQRVRYVAIGEVNQTRLQVFSQDGSQLFDSTFRLGNLVDWQLVDQQGQPLTDGSYLFLVTVKDFSGNLTQKYGTAQLEQGLVALQQSTRDDLPAGQAASLQANQQAATLAAVDRIGVTATDTIALDSSSTTSPNPTSPKKNATTTTASPNVAGTGTPNQVTKWTDSAGTLGNSAITEINGNVGINNTSPQAALQINGNQFINPAGAIPTYEVLKGSDPSSTVMLTTNGSNFGWQIAPTNAATETIVQILGQGFGSTANRGEFGIYLGSDSNSAFKVVQRGGAELFRVTRTGNVGIGTSSPAAQLDVNGATTLRPGGSGGTIQFGTPNAETGMTISSTNRADVRFDGTTLKLLAGPGVTSPANGIAIDTAGNVGIGIFAPQNKLVVNAGGSGGTVNFGTPGGESGMAIIGTNRADVRFDGQTLKLLAGTGPGAMAPTNGININGAGNVGIGTTTPAHRLSLIGGPTWTSNQWTGALELGNASAIGWQANAGGQRFGIGQTTGGLYFFRTASDPGTTGSPANYDFEIGDGGELHAYNNAEQALDKGGWVKAMAYIDGDDGSIFQCFNSRLTGSAATTGTCGITSTRHADGVYDIDFGFTISNRFISVTPRYVSRSTPAHNVGANFTFTTTTSVSVLTFAANNADDTNDAHFMIIVY